MRPSTEYAPSWPQPDSGITVPVNTSSRGAGAYAVSALEESPSILSWPASLQAITPAARGGDDDGYTAGSEPSRCGPVRKGKAPLPGSRTHGPSRRTRSGNRMENRLPDLAGAEAESRQKELQQPGMIGALSSYRVLKLSAPTFLRFGMQRQRRTGIASNCCARPALSRRRGYDAQCLGATLRAIRAPNRGKHTFAPTCCLVSR